MPEAVTIAISVGAQEDIDAPLDNSAMIYAPALRRENNNEALVAQSEGARTAAALLPSSHATAHTPINNKGGTEKPQPQNHSPESRNSSGSIFTNSHASQIEIKNVVAKGAPAVEDLKPLQKNNAKISSPRSKKLPTKNNRVELGLPLYQSVPNPPTKPSPTKKRAGGKSPFKLPLRRNITPKSKRPGDGGSSKKPTKKQANKKPKLDTMSDTGSSTQAKSKATCKVAPAAGSKPGRKRKTKSPASNTSKRGRGESPKPPKQSTPRSKKSSIENVASDVVDAVSDEIRYCASVFGARRPKVVIAESEGLPHKDTGASETKSSERANAGYSLTISAEGTISRVKNSASRPNAISTETQVFDADAVAVAVRRFVLEVYFPFLRSAQKSVGNDSPNFDRVRISVLLAVREMLVMNADKLFSFSTMGRSSACTAKEKEYLSCVFANAIVRNAAQRLLQSQRVEGTFADFVKATRNYDAQSDEFQFALTSEGARSVHAYPNGEQVGPEESLIAKVGFNYARTKHPLLRSKPVGSISDSDGAQVGIVKRSKESGARPKPTACAVFHIEEVDASESDEDDEAKALESVEQVLKRKRASQQAEKILCA